MFPSFRESFAFIGPKVSRARLCSTGRYYNQRRTKTPDRDVRRLALTSRVSQPLQAPQSHLPLSPSKTPAVGLAGPGAQMASE